MNEPTVRVTRYTVNALPEGVRDRHYWDLHVIEQRDGRWLITDGAYWWGRDGEQHMPFSGVYEQCAFATAEEALGLARVFAPNVTVNGRTPAAVLNRQEQQ